MSDRINGFVVVLDKNYKDDDIEPTLNAIRQIKGVIEVIPNVASVQDSIAHSRAKIEVQRKILDMLDNL